MKKTAMKLLERVGLADKAEKLSDAIETANRTAPITGTREGASCAQFGDAVIAAL